jgi:hypothetical protein
MSSPNRRRWVKVTLITLIVIYIGVQLTLSVIHMIHDQRIEGLAREWFNQAQQDAKPTWTEDDAAQWLDHHGTVPYRGEGSDSSGQYYVVAGYPQIYDGGIVTEPASVFITFVFGPDHRFVRIKYKVWPFESPSAKSVEYKKGS